MLRSGINHKHQFLSQTFSECQENTYETSSGCVECPKNSTSKSGSKRCDCVAGKYWSEINDTCVDCQVGYYSVGGMHECLKCPQGTTAEPGSSFCDCSSGLYFSQGHCKVCTENTYSTGSTATCETCPPGSGSVPSSDTCNCTGGMFWSENKCEVCPDSYYSYKGSTNCTLCPNNYTSSPYQAFCVCPPRQYWDMRRNNCEECPANHYNDISNQTLCRTCPAHSISQPGSLSCSCAAGYKLLNSSFCQICPENHYSVFGSLECLQCPHFKAAAPGSEFCYRCSLGEYWENHTCLQCPRHLYGDGVHCLECPPVFQVEYGFCYKLADKDSLAQVMKPLRDSHYVIIFWVFLITLVLVSKAVWIKRNKIQNLLVCLKQKCRKSQDTEGRGKERNVGVEETGTVPNLAFQWHTEDETFNEDI